MRILAVVGSLGSGKSSLVEHTILYAAQSGMINPNRVAYLLNDRLSPDGRMLDGEKIRNIARVIPFPNRCFTCEDTDTLVRQLRTLSDEGEIDLVVIEGYGFVAGGETHHALEMTGFPFEIISLVDAEHLTQNRAAYGAVIESQVASATLGIGITHAVNGQTEAEAALDFVAHHTQPGVPSLVIPKGYGIPTRLFARALLGDQHEHHHDHVACGCGHQHGLHYHGHAHHHHSPHDHHGHDHDHTHHDFFSVTYTLHANVTIKMLREVLSSADVFRAKGVVGGVRFDVVHGLWSVGDADKRQSIITLYSHGNEVQLPDHFIDMHARADTDTRSTKDLLRHDVDPESARLAVARLAEAIPTNPVILPGSDGYRVAVQLEELQLLKQIAQRPTIKDELLLKAVDIAIRYWTACARFINDHENQMDQHELPVSRLELGLSLGWWTNRFEMQLKPELVMAVAECRVGKLLDLGMTGRWLHSNPKQAAAQAVYFLDVTRFAARHGEDRTELVGVLKRGITSAQHADSSVLDAWQKAYREFENK